MTGALQLINALISLLALADKLGLNVDLVKAKFDQAKAEGRDVSDAEVKEMADAAEAASERLEHLINQLPPT
jgi:hypothetical protein